MLTLKPQDDRSGFYFRLLYDRTAAAYHLYYVFALIEKTEGKSGRSQDHAMLSVDNILLFRE